jgi:hypothetical protein
MRYVIKIGGGKAVHRTEYLVYWGTRNDKVDLPSGRMCWIRFVLRVVRFVFY